tara:strand:- start:129 stop:422 length:294 start_codon:yes stop_codon:yes gene_type:complete
MDKAIEFILASNSSYEIKYFFHGIDKPNHTVPSEGKKCKGDEHGTADAETTKELGHAVVSTRCRTTLRSFCSHIILLMLAQEVRSTTSHESPEQANV